MRESFRHNYEIEEGSWLPGDGRGRVFYYPGAKRDGGRNGVIVAVKPKDTQAWIGCFAFGYRSNRVLTEISSCPNPNEVCVVSSGSAYVVRVNDPEQWQTLSCFPVTQLLEIPDRGLLVFCDFTKLLALGAEGVKWVSPHLASDGLKILHVGNGSLRVRAWRAEINSEIETQVDLLTGQEIR
jgi:hypothetical protein